MRRREFLGWIAGGIAAVAGQSCAKKEPTFDDLKKKGPVADKTKCFKTKHKEFRDVVWKRLQQQQLRWSEPMWVRALPDTLVSFATLPLWNGKAVRNHVSFDISEYNNNNINELVDCRCLEATCDMIECHVDRINS